MNEDKVAARPNILIVDDTPANLRLLSQMLGQHGYKVRVANDGRHALESIHANPPDLILLDIMMPGMDGYQVCEQLKRTPTVNAIPVIFLSALDASLDKVKAFAAGGVDYITKPFQLEEVLARVAAHLGLHNLQRQLEAQNRQLEAEIAERERAQNALRQYADELEASNAELDAFAHTVAHDLKNPIAAILGFSSLLEARYSKMSAEKVTESLQRITRSARKMTSIVDELLLLASVRKMEEIECRPLDMAHLLAETRTRLRDMLERTGATLIMPGTWPTAYGYAPWLK